MTEQDTTTVQWAKDIAAYQEQCVKACAGLNPEAIPGLVEAAEEVRDTAYIWHGSEQVCRECRTLRMAGRHNMGCRLGALYTALAKVKA